MNEAQEKPKRRWYKKWQFITAVLVIIAAIISLVVWAVGNQYNTCCYHELGPSGVREQIQNGVAAYASQNNGSLPILNGTYTNANCSNCSVVNISALISKNGGILRQAPISLYLSADGNDNCGGNKSLGCSPKNHYIWIVNTSWIHFDYGDIIDGSVYSYCTGADCNTNNSGYQGVWP